MKKFEYKILDVPTKGWFGGRVDYEALQEKLNENGALGWEVASATGTNMYEGGSRAVIIILKREKN
jgi:Domain of unknown function (DUF4177)